MNVKINFFLIKKISHFILIIFLNRFITVNQIRLAFSFNRKSIYIDLIKSDKYLFKIDFVELLRINLDWMLVYRFPFKVNIRVNVDRLTLLQCGNTDKALV